MRKWLFISVFLTFIFACKHRDKDNIIPRRDLVPLLIDMHIADAMALNTSVSGQFGGLDSSLLYQSVLDKYGYTKDDLTRTLRR